MGHCRQILLRQANILLEPLQYRRGDAVQFHLERRLGHSRGLTVGHGWTGVHEVILGGRSWIARRSADELLECGLRSLLRGTHRSLRAIGRGHVTSVHLREWLIGPYGTETAHGLRRARSVRRVWWRVRHSRGLERYPIRTSLLRSTRALSSKTLRRHILTLWRRNARWRRTCR